MDELDVMLAKEKSKWRTTATGETRPAPRDNPRAARQRRRIARDPDDEQRRLRASGE